MHMKNNLHYLVLSILLTACSSGELASYIPDNRPNYKQSSMTNPLEIPPDLTQSSIDDGLMVGELSGTDSASLATYQNERSASSYQDRSLEANLKNIHSNGSATWIEIADKPDNVFNNAKKFWINNGLGLTRVDKNIGIMETDWLESKSSLPSSGISSIINRLISNLHDNGKRDKFRTRIDYDGEKSFVYLTHYGATEAEIKDFGHGQGEGFYEWKSSSRNPELEAEMLRRLNLYLVKSQRKAAIASASQGGKSKQQQSTVQLAQLNDGQPALVINNSDYNKGWILLGIAIDRAGYDLSEQNRQQGIYRFAKITETERGLLFKDKTKTIDDYTLGISDQGNQQIAIITAYNKQPISAPAAQVILQKIAENIQL
ncbi:MAG: hypothetical protein CSA47_01090 [Gammaproteobacteria bacterium]|nr:MAG: hypothetical protein CSA47_01090 [Gammaproteobacteria bacterium]